MDAAVTGNSDPVPEEYEDLAYLARTLERELNAAKDVIEEMDRIHNDIMENGPRCTCGDGDAWCARCGKSQKLSGLAAKILRE